MTKLELLKKYENMASHNLFCYSRNLGMTEPKEGFERQWKQAKEECELLEELMKEVTQEVPVFGQLLSNFSFTVQLEAYVKEHHPTMHEEARGYVKEVLVNEKGLRLYDISKLIDCRRPSLSRFVRGEYESVWLTEQILAFKERMKRTVPVSK